MREGKRRKLAVELGPPEITLEPSSPPHVCPAVPRSEYCLVSRTHSFQACSQRESSEEGNAVILSVPVQSSLVSRTRWVTCQNQGICSELTELALALVLVYLMTLGNNRKTQLIWKDSHTSSVHGFWVWIWFLFPFVPPSSLPLLSATEREIAYFRGSRLDCAFLPLLSMPVTGSPFPPVSCLSFVMPFPGK